MTKTNPMIQAAHRAARIAAAAAFATLVCAGTASAGPTPAVKCEVGKLKTVAGFASCLRSFFQPCVTCSKRFFPGLDVKSIYTKDSAA